MRQYRLYTLLSVCLLLVESLLFAQEVKPPFWNDVQAFQQQDATTPPPQHPVLLIGSSSFTRWKDVQSYFPNTTILNRAFGGSTLLDLIHYHDKIVDPYDPRQILIYCGENDLASSDSVTVDMVVDRFKKLYKLIRKKYHQVPIVYVSMKPSPSRERLLPKYEQANGRIYSFLSAKKNTVYVDVYTKMYTQDQKIMQDIFVEDRLHMNAKGYAIWQKILDPVILKN